MKVIFVLFVLVAVGWVGVYYVGGYASFDPSEQARLARDAVTPGMTFQEVCEAAGVPRKFQVIRREVHRVGGVEIVEFKPFAESKTSRENIESRIADGTVPDGFQTTYRYSQSVAFTVKYDGQGTVVDVFDEYTMTDLLQTRDR